MHSNGKKNVILYDFLQVKGGAEAVTLDICKHFDNMDLITGWVNTDCFETLPLDRSRVTSLTSSTSMQGWQTIKCAQAFLNSRPDLSQYDNAIFSGSNAPLALLKNKAKKNIYYCHTPPRFIYDLKDYYLDSVPLWQKPVLKVLIAWMQPMYEEALSHMDVMLCNSKNVQGRLKKFLGIDAEVVYPPVNINRFKYISDGDYFLSTARLEPYKRIETIVRAFMEMPDKKLVVTSGGSQERYLRELAKDFKNITFTGWVSEDDLRKLIGNCLATIYISKDEDFGMSPIESMGAGKPVITSNSGGTAETIIDGETGWFLEPEPSIEQLKSLVSSLQPGIVRNMAVDCYARAQVYYSALFFEAIGRILQYQNHRNLSPIPTTKSKEYFE